MFSYWRTANVNLFLLDALWRLQFLQAERATRSPDSSFSSRSIAIKTQMCQNSLEQIFRETLDCRPSALPSSPYYKNRRHAYYCATQQFTNQETAINFWPYSMVKFITWSSWLVGLRVSWPHQWFDCTSWSCDKGLLYLPVPSFSNPKSQRWCVLDERRVFMSHLVDMTGIKILWFLSARSHTDIRSAMRLFLLGRRLMVNVSTRVAILSIGT